MKILVCISHVPDTTTKIQFTPDKTSINANGVTFIIDPYGEYGLSRAIGFTEEGKQAEIVALCVGGAEVEPTLRKALAIGANKAVRIDAPAGDPGYVARQIAAYAGKEGFDILFTGKESIDFNGSIVPGMIAELLHMPFVSFATSMALDGDDKASFHREIDGGEEVLETKLPVVVSCQKGIAEWRIPNMRGIMAARTKPLEVVAPVEVVAYLETTGYDYPPVKGDCKYFPADQPEELVSTLFQKGLI